MLRNENMDRSSISPSTNVLNGNNNNNDQKIIFYEKHIKKIEK